MRWLILAVLFTARTVMAFQFQTIGSSGSLLVRDLGFSYSDIGTLIGLYLLPGVVIAFPGGLLGQRFGVKVVLGGLALMALGGAIDAEVTSVGALAAGRLVGGVGAVLLNVLLVRMVADWFTDRSVTVALGVLVTSWPLGVGAGLAFGNAIAAAHGWPALMLTSSALALACLVLLAAIYRDPPDTPAAAPAGVRLTALEWRMSIIAGAIWAAYNVGFIVLISFAPQLLVARGYSQSQGSTIVSLLGWLLVPMIVVGGLLTARFGRSNLIMAASFGVTALLIAVMPFTTLLTPIFVVVALAAGLPAGAIMALPVEVLRAESRATGMGVYFTCFYAGMAVLPALAGWIRDRAQSAAAPVLFASAMMACALGLLVLFRGLQRAAQQSATSPSGITSAS